MSTNEINHAVRLEGNATCSKCDAHLCDLLFQKQKLLITQCRHIFDHACYLLLGREAAARGAAPSCTCGEVITKAELLTPNLYGECVFHKFFPHREQEVKEHECLVDFRLPPSIEESLNQRNQVMILNCGHLVHALCWMDFLFAVKGNERAVCPACKITYFDAMPFRVRTLKLEKCTLPEAIALEREFTDLGGAASGTVDAIIEDFEEI